MNNSSKINKLVADYNVSVISWLECFVTVNKGNRGGKLNEVM